MAYTNGITGSPLLHTLLTQADSAGAARGPRESPTSSSVAKDSTQLSTAASALQGGSEAARAAKVGALQAAVANGTYSVPAAAVADKLMQSLLQR